MVDKEKKTRAKRASLGFQIFEIIKVEETASVCYTPSCDDKFKSLFETESFIRKNADKFKDKTLVIMHVKKEIKVSTESKPVAKLEETS